MVEAKISPPSDAFLHAFVVRAEHIDDLGHAGNVVWVAWVNDAAIAHSQSVGLGPATYSRMGIIWVVRKHEIEYLAPAFEGQKIEASTWIEDLRGATSLRRTLFRSPEGSLFARAATRWALIDTSTGRPRRIPQELLERYGFSKAKPFEEEGRT